MAIKDEQFSHFMCVCVWERESILYVCMLYTHVCASAHTYAWCGGPRRTSSVTLCHSPPSYSFATGSLADSEVRHEPSHCLYFIHISSSLGMCVLMPRVFCGCRRVLLLCSEHSCCWAVFSPTWFRFYHRIRLVFSLGEASVQISPFCEPGCFADSIYGFTLWVSIVPRMSDWQWGPPSCGSSL